METGIVSVAAITVISFLAAQAVKATKLDHRWLPVICGVVGAALGLAALYIMPDFPANNPLTAVAVGIVSGLAATGSNELIKQLKGCESNDNN